MYTVQWNDHEGNQQQIQFKTLEDALLEAAEQDKKYVGVQIFDPNGNLKGVTPYVNDISFVSPSLNSASEFFRLITYRSVVAVAEVNRLGYIVQTLEYQNEEFLPVFTEFALKL